MDGRTVTVMKLSTLELNRLADNIVAQGLTCYLHTGDPGANGTANRIAGVSAQLSAASWSNAADGDVTYNADIEFAQLHATRTITPTALTIFRGAALDQLAAESWADTPAILLAVPFAPGSPVCLSLIHI